jgi:hypothetical protein
MFILRVIDALDRHKVEYAVVGGFAVALHGAVRGTVDLDVVVDFSKASFVAAEKALLSLGLECRLPVGAAEVFEFREEYIRNRNLIAWSFYNPSRPSEVVDVVITHDLRKQKIKSFGLEGRRIRVLAVESLIKMKRESGRPQDLEDIRALEKLKK